MRHQTYVSVLKIYAEFLCGLAGNGPAHALADGNGQPAGLSAVNIGGHQNTGLFNRYAFHQQHGCIDMFRSLHISLTPSKGTFGKR